MEGDPGVMAELCNINLTHLCKYIQCKVVGRGFYTRIIVRLVCRTSVLSDYINYLIRKLIYVVLIVRYIKPHDFSHFLSDFLD